MPDRRFRDLVREEGVKLFFGAVAAAVGVFVVAWANGVLRGDSVEVSPPAVTAQARGDHLRELGLTPTPDEQAGENDPGVRVEAKLKVHGYRRLVVECTVTDRRGHDQVKRIVWSRGDSPVTVCWLPVIGSARGSHASVRVYRVGERRSPLDRAGPAPLQSS
jgi:hypothetical protein